MPAGHTLCCTMVSFNFETYISASFQIAPALPVLENLPLQLAAIIVLHSLPQVLPHGLLLPCKAVPLEHGKCHQVILMSIVTSSCI
jgi:hypothetical protein